MEKRDLLTRLDQDGVVCAEGFLFEMERRGYLTSGEFVPELALEHPEALRNLHKDFQFAGSDVVEAFTYNGHREKMRVINKEDLLEPLNRAALQIAREVANDVPQGAEPNLLAGNISNTNIWHPTDTKAQQQVRAMFEEMIGWAIEEGADFAIGETFYYAEEAFCALDVMQKAGIEAVLTIAPMGENKMRDDWDIIDTCKELEARGAKVVGMNCFRGPNTMLPYILAVRKQLKCHVAALPIPYRTTEQEPTFFNLSDSHGCSCPAPHGRTFPTALDPLYVNRYEIKDFASTCWQHDIKYLGVCCGASPMHIREVAKVMGKNPAGIRYYENMDNHFIYGSNERIAKHVSEYGDKA